jgi:lipase chaperone LimK
MLTLYVAIALLVSIYFVLNEAPGVAQESEFQSSLSVSGLNKTPGRHQDNTLNRDMAHELPYVSNLGDLPSSLDGAQMRMELAVDEAGHLRVSSDLKDLMDFFLSAIDDEDLELILARIDEYLDYQLDEPALSEARAALDSYINLKLALFDLEQELGANTDVMESSGDIFGSGGLDSLEQQLRQRNELRAQLLSPEMHEAFYARSEAYDEFMLEQFKIKANKNLDPEQRQEMLEQSEMNADPEIIASRRASMPVQILHQETERLRQSGGSEEDVRQLRTGMYGEEAAQRLEQLDTDRNDWKGRVDAYFASKGNLIQGSGLSGPELDTAVSELRSSSFSDTEQVRIKIMEGRKDKI